MMKRGSYGNEQSTKLMGVFEEIIIFIISYGYYFAAIPFVLGIIGAILKANEVF
jgi:hypothetical protein